MFDISTKMLNIDNTQEGMTLFEESIVQNSRLALPITGNLIVKGSLKL